MQLATLEAGPSASSTSKPSTPRVQLPAAAVEVQKPPALVDIEEASGDTSASRASTSTMQRRNSRASSRLSLREGKSTSRSSKVQKLMKASVVDSIKLRMAQTAKLRALNKRKQQIARLLLVLCNVSLLVMCAGVELALRRGPEAWTNAMKTANILLLALMLGAEAWCVAASSSLLLRPSLSAAPRPSSDPPSAPSRHPSSRPLAALPCAPRCPSPPISQVPRGRRRLRCDDVAHPVCL